MERTVQRIQDAPVRRELDKPSWRTVVLALIHSLRKHILLRQEVGEIFPWPKTIPTTIMKIRESDYNLVNIVSHSLLRAVVT